MTFERIYTKRISKCEDCPDFRNIPNDHDYCSDTLENIDNKEAIHPLCRLKAIDPFEWD